jgi:flagellar biosynthetic protein FliR
VLSELYPYAWNNYLDITMVFLRLLGLFILAPAFNHKSIPGVIKIALALSLSLALYPVVRPFLPAFPGDFSGIVSLAVRETLIGFFMGFSAHLAVEGIHVAAQFIGFQMGFGVGGLMDPQMQSSVTVMVPLYGWIVLMLFFLLNLHHEIIYLFVYSFKITKGIEASFLQNDSLLKLIVAMFGELFITAVKMAAPFTLLALASNATVGILNRLMPQMNVLLFSFPITILLGFITFYLVAPELLDFIENVIEGASEKTVAVLKAL